MAIKTVSGATTGVVNDGTGVDWTDPINAGSGLPGTYATANTTGHTKYLKVMPFGFGQVIKERDIILGLQVNVLRSVFGGSEVCVDHSVRVIKGNAYVGTDKADTVNNWPTTDVEKSYGGPTDLWGTTWTASDVIA